MDFRQQHISDLNFVMIGRESTLKGEFHFQGPGVIEGKLEGELTMAPETHLCLGRSAQVQGKISAHDVDIFGKFEGELKAFGRVRIFASANTSGPIEALELSIASGATVNMSAKVENPAP